MKGVRGRIDMVDVYGGGGSRGDMCDRRDRVITKYVG